MKSLTIKMVWKVIVNETEKNHLLFYMKWVVRDHLTNERLKPIK